jgi:hypothetical protein
MMRLCSTNRSIKYAWTRINQIHKASLSRSAQLSFSANAPKEEIKTISIVRIPTRNEYHRVPLTLVDVHLRDEQLPFAFFFDETLDFDKLASSLEQVLKHYPVMSGRIDFEGKDAGSPVAIQCGPEDAVSLSYGISDKPLSFWTSRGHSYSGGGGHPILLPIFDPLFQSGKQSASNDGVNSYSRLATFRVIHFAGGGTAITATFNHALADAASSLRFVECWGRETRKKLYSKSVSHDRSSATLSGMISTELAEILGLSSPKANDLLPDFISSRYSVYRKEMQDFFHNIFGSKEAEGKEMEEASSTLAESGHEYVVLLFPPMLLKKMKTHGMAQCKADAQTNSKDDFVSTNDMVTAFGWIMKRQLSGQQDWNMSMVVNLRGRGGVDAFSDLNSLEGCGKGVFGNAITNVFASMPARQKLSPRTDVKLSLCVNEISRAASSIRAALVAGLLDVPERVSMSKLGRPVQPVPPAGSSFATTSWGDFPLWKIRFANERMVGFHGHPSFPLPVGRTFSSVIAPTKDGGCQYKLLLPSDKASEARMLHKHVSDDFMNSNNCL